MTARSNNQRNFSSQEGGRETYTLFQTTPNLHQYNFRCGVKKPQIYITKEASHI